GDGGRRRIGRGPGDLPPRQSPDAWTDRRASAADDPRGRAPAFPAFLAQTPSRAGALAGERLESPYRPGDGEPRLAPTFRQGAGSVGRQLRQARRAPLTPGAPRLAGHPIRRRRLVAEGASPADPALASLSDEHGLG